MIQGSRSATLKNKSLAGILLGVFYCVGGKQLNRNLLFDKHTFQSRKE